MILVSEASVASERYIVRESGYGVCRGWTILDLRGRSLDFAPAYVDKLRTRSAAEYAARLLNRGLATVNPHGLIGCRVEVRNG